MIETLEAPPLKEGKTEKEQTPPQESEAERGLRKAHEEVSRMPLFDTEGMKKQIPPSDPGEEKKKENELLDIDKARDEFVKTESKGPAPETETNPDHGPIWKGVLKPKESQE